MEGNSQKFEPVWSDGELDTEDSRKTEITSGHRHVEMQDGLDRAEKFHVYEISDGQEQSFLYLFFSK